MTYLRPLIPHLACLALVIAVAPFDPLAPTNAAAHSCSSCRSFDSGTADGPDVLCRHRLALSLAMIDVPAYALGQGEATRILMIGGSISRWA